MTNENTDSDEPTKAELHDRVEKLESTVAKMMPSRRDALRMGAAGLAGAAGLSAASQSAEASTGSAGAIGSTSDRPDLIADDVGPRSIASDYLYAGEFSGSDQNTRLQNALAAADDGDVIYLESAIYDPITIGKLLTVIGTGYEFSGTVIDGWTLDGNVNLKQCIIGTNSLEIPSAFSEVSDVYRGNITVKADNVGVIAGGKLTVTFQSGTSGGIADSLYDGSSVTDNGNNTVGDIA